MTRFDCYEDQRDAERAAHNRSIRSTDGYEPDASDYWCDCDDVECGASHDDCSCPKACERHETHACEGCSKARPGAELVHLDAGERWCPACVLVEYERLEGDWDLSGFADELQAHGVRLPGVAA